MTADASTPTGLSGPPTDALIVGAGPAGLALAAELTVRGLSVRVTDPAPHAPFPATYGAWHDDLPGWAQDCAAHTWADVRVHTGPQPTPLLRPYTLLDNAALRAALLGRAGPELTLTAARVDGAVRLDGAARTAGGWTVQGTQDGQPARWEARVVIDASGHQPALLRQADRHPDGAALQTAYGIVATFDRPPSAPGAVVWMDYRAPHGDGDRRGGATFLYAMHLGGDRYFVEETSLIARPAPTRQDLEARLHARLRAQGTPPREIISDEWVCFPMNTAPPAPDGVLAFGAAAGLVHPISGFQVSGALRDVPAVADAIAGALRDGSDPVQAGWDALWPPERRAARAVHLLGVQALLNLPPRALPAFFAAFFALPPARWHAFLDPRTLPGPLARTMLRLFAHAPAHVRLPLARAALRHAGTSLHALNAAARTLTA